MEVRESKGVVANTVVERRSGEQTEGFRRFGSFGGRRTF